MGRLCLSEAQAMERRRWRRSGERIHAKLDNPGNARSVAIDGPLRGVW